MPRAAWIVVAVAVGLVAAMWSRQAVGVVDNAQAEDSADEQGGAVQSADSGGFTDQAAQALDQANPFAVMEQSTMTAATADANVQAFLDMIAFSEGTARAQDPYRVCYGYRHTVQSFDRHPAAWFTDDTGQRVREWGGEPLDALGPTYAGKVSTAAGRYQIIRPTWDGCARALALADFAPESQDKAAAYIVREAGALDLVQAGQFDQAVALCAPQWASLPGANAVGQGMRRLDDLRTAYVNAGGTLA